MIIWICGPSGAGKTTVGKALYDCMKPDMTNLFLLDGDQFRKAMANDLGYSSEDRLKNGLRIARFCQLLESQGINVICCAATIPPDVQKLNREIFREYYEILIEVTFDTLCKRDTKQIYSKALSGEMSDVVGVDLLFEPPAAPHLTINNDRFRTSFSDLVQAVLSGINDSTD